MKYFCGMLLCVFLPTLAVAEDVPDLSEVDKKFRAGKYSDALVGYLSCERNQVGDAGYVIYQEVICADKIADEIQRSRSLRKLCNLEIAGKNEKYVNAAYDMRYKLLLKRSSSSDLDKFVREAIKKFHGKGFSVSLVTKELKKLISQKKWREALRYYKKNSVSYSRGTTNIMAIVDCHFVRGEKATVEQAKSLAIAYEEDSCLTTFVAEQCLTGPNGWLFCDALGDIQAVRGRMNEALEWYERAKQASKPPVDMLDYKILSVKLTDVTLRRKAIGFAIDYLKRTESKWHFAMFCLTLKAMLSEKSLDEADLLLRQYKITRPLYFTDEIQSLENAVRAAISSREKERAIARLNDEDRRMRRAINLRRKRLYAESLTECDCIIRGAKSGGLIKQAQKLAAEICFEDLCDYGAAQTYYLMLSESCGDEVGCDVDFRLFSCLLILGRSDDAQLRINEFKRKNANRLDVDEVNKLDNMLVLAQKPRRASEDSCVRMREASVLFCSGEYLAALRAYKSIASLKGVGDVARREALMQTARCLARIGETKQAVDVYQMFVRRYGRCQMSSDALMRLAVLYAGAAGDFDKAVECYVRVEEEYPRTDNAECAMFNRMTLLMWLERWEEAERVRKGYLRNSKRGGVRNIVENAYGDVIKRRKF